jgi:cytochrome c oxidase subunit 5b
MFGLSRRLAGTAVGAASRQAQKQRLIAPASISCQLQAKRGYRHWWRVLPEDFELNTESMPKDVKKLMSSDPYEMSFLDSYWYWRIRSESTIMDPENLPKKNYKQLCRDMGLSIVNEPAEHALGIIELYEYLKSSPFIGPFGTIENPVLVPAIMTERVVGCSGGTGDMEHVPLWFRCKEGFLYRCGECDQIFMLVRVMYELPDGQEIDPIDPDVNDVFDIKLLEKGNEVWNSGGMINWPTGYDAVHGTIYGGSPRDEWNTQRAIGE